MLIRFSSLSLRFITLNSEMTQETDLILIFILIANCKKIYQYYWIE